MLNANEIKKDFPILSRLVYEKPLVYLDNAATTQKPKTVIQKLVDYYEKYNSNVHRGVHALSIEATDLFEESRLKVAKFIKAQTPESIIWTRNTTEAINLIANTWGMEHINKGDEIVLTQMEHHSNLVPWQKIAKDKEAILRFIPVTEDGQLELDEIDSIINTKTKLLAMVHISNSLGTINPVEYLTSKARSVGASILIDGAQSVPHIPIDVNDLDCDFLAFSGHKMLGPTGIGVLYVKQDVLRTMEPFLRGGEMVLEVWFDKAKWNHLPMKFEAGTPNIGDAIAFGSSIDYLNTIGMENVRKHEIELTQYALNEMKSIGEFSSLGPEDMNVRGGIISLHSPNIHAHDIGTILDRQGVAIRAGHHCNMPLMRTIGVTATARASFYIYNTEEDVDMFISGLKQTLRYFTDGVTRPQ